MDAAKCPSCGATGSGLVCTYCGSRIRESVDETLALVEFHQLLGSESGENLAKLLKHGYLPTAEGPLIEAGFKCLPYMGDDIHSDEGEGAALRLETVVARLRVGNETEQSTKAIAEFESHLKRYRTDQKQSTRMGCAILVVIPLLILAVILWWAFA